MMPDNGFRNWLSDYYNELVYEAAHEKDPVKKSKYRIMTSTLYYVAHVYDDMECPEVREENVI